MAARISDLEHELKNTRPSRATPERESNFTAGRPKCPEYFSDEKRHVWKYVVKLFAARRVLTKADGPAIALYVDMHQRHQALLHDLEEHGKMITETDSKGNERHVGNPAGKLATSLEAQLRAILREFGGTPLTREKSKPAKAATKREEEFEPGTVGWLLRQKARTLANTKSAAAPVAEEEYDETTED